ncbi:MAG: N-acetylmuramoyl-L-alanine amidase [bacterium]|nr:N-acetylmuramoyl-L-alanine amidase [bacterium]
MKYRHNSSLYGFFSFFFFRSSIFFLITFILMSTTTSAWAKSTVAKSTVVKTTVANSARLGGDAKRMTFAVNLSKKVAIKVFTLAKPYRVIIDLPEVKFHFPSGYGRKAKGLVSAYRYGLFAPGKSRIVIDVKHPVLVTKAQVIDVSGDKPARMEIILVKTTKEKFTLNQAKQNLGKGMSSQKPETKKPASKTKTKDATSKEDPRPMIVIDPGHGGVDPGAIGSKGTLEKKVVLMFSRRLRKQLLATGLYRVTMTRDIDTYIPLHDRVKIGRRNKASLFISIHADSISKKRRRRNSVRGSSIYILSNKASDAEAKALAALENRSDIIAGIELPESQNPVTNILIDLAQRETNKLSYMFAKLQLKQMRGAVKLHGYRTRSAGFRVLKAPDTPSVLLELGYLSSIHDEKNLKSPKWQKKMGKVLLKSIEAYFTQQVAVDPY